MGVKRKDQTSYCAFGEEVSLRGLEAYKGFSLKSDYETSLFQNQPGNNLVFQCDTNSL